MKPGTRVRMTASYRDRLCVYSVEHAVEFGECVGVVLGPSDNGPEVLVSWEPSGLRYSYLPEDLVEVG